MSHCGFGDQVVVPQDVQTRVLNRKKERLCPGSLPATRSKVEPGRNRSCRTAGVTAKHGRPGEYGD
jgi:hypothetical protein